MERSHRLQVQIFHAGTPGKLAEQVNDLPADLPAAFVRWVRFQTAAVSATTDEEPRWEHAALVEFEASDEVG